MINAAHARLMATYNQWMNEKLYATCAQIDDADRRRDLGAFFGSVHATLNHILYGDLAFLSRFTGDPPTAPALGVDLYDSFDALRVARASIDARLVDWTASLTQAWLAEPLTYVSNVDKAEHTVTRWVLVTHLFNHQTHHRGQVTTLLSQLGHDIGATDLPFMPGVDRF